MTYKRSQVEDAICFGLRGEARSKQMVRIKRLLDIDRKLEMRQRANQKTRFAFFSEEGPGTGQETSFQAYEVFALEVALGLAAQGIPQTDVVEIVRALRPHLEGEHRKILATPLEYYSDIRRAERHSEPVASKHPVFLSVSQAAGRRTTFKTRAGFTAELMHGGEAWWHHFWQTQGKAATTLEITLTAHSLHHQLSRVEPRKKGRH